MLKQHICSGQAQGGRTKSILREMWVLKIVAEMLLEFILKTAIKRHSLFVYKL